MMYPSKVNELNEFFIDKSTWHNITYNHHAMSCCDAANKRFRLGHEGIPCFDELKSNFGFFLYNGEKRYVIFHCRGTQKIDHKKISRLLGAKFMRLPKNELKDKFNLEYGLVNPFLLSKRFPKVQQYFDKTVFKKFLPPYTMMTNAGHHNWAVEFDPNELHKTITDFIVEDIIGLSEVEFRKPVIGILTGNPPESGILLWEKINSSIRKELGSSFLGDISFPKVLIDSLPEIGFSMELKLREKQTKNNVLESIKNLCENGATLIAIACNTTQYFSNEIHEICNKYNATFITIQESLIRFLEQKKINHFDFLGITYATDFEKWSDFKKLNRLFKIEIPEEQTLKEINQLAFKVKENSIDMSNTNKLRNLITNTTKTNHIIIALTEISILLASQKKKSKNGNHFYDTLSILAKEITSRYLDEIAKIY